MHAYSHARICSNDSLDDETLTDDLNDKVPEQGIFDFLEEDDILINEGTIVADVISNRSKQEVVNYNSSSNSDSTKESN